MEVSQGLQATAPFWGALMPQLLHVCPSGAAQEREGESLNTSWSYNEHNVALDKPARARGTSQPAMLGSHLYDMDGQV